jgi:hypothetical protein
VLFEAVKACLTRTFLSRASYVPEIGTTYVKSLLAAVSADNFIYSGPFVKFEIITDFILVFVLVGSLQIFALCANIPEEPVVANANEATEELTLVKELDKTTKLELKELDNVTKFVLSELDNVTKFALREFDKEVSSVFEPVIVLLTITRFELKEDDKFVVFVSMLAKEAVTAPIELPLISSIT